MATGGYKPCGDAILAAGATHCNPARPSYNTVRSAGMGP
jgi:hypothetical protein